MSSPQRIKHFELKERIGLGGFASVFLAFDTKLGREVAIKMIRPDLAGNRSTQQTFRTEARAVAQLSHQGIVPLYELINHRGGFALVMEYVRGETLAQRLMDGPVSSMEAARIGFEVAQAMAHAHKRGLIHRDLKPSNLILGEDGRVRVMDFGLARVLPEFPLLNLDTSSTAESANFVAGTPSYMSPEQVRGQGLDSRSDQFSFAVVLYEAVTGSRPFRGKTRRELSQAIRFGEPDWQGEAARRMDPRLAAVLSRALAKETAERYADMETMAHDLEIVSRVALSVEPAAQPTPGIVGRRDELSRLQEMIESAAEPGGSGRTVVVAGEAGVGKTTLVEEFVRLTTLSRRIPKTVVSFREGNAGFRVVAQAMRALLESHADELGERLRDELASSMTVRTESQARVFPELLDSAVMEIARRGTFLLVIENIHDAGHDGIAALRALVAAIPSTKGVLALTYRSGEWSPRTHLRRDFLLWTRRERLADDLPVARFSSDETRELIGRLLSGGTPDDGLVKRVQRETEGNPLFVLETIRYLNEIGRLSSSGVLLKTDEPLPLPKQVRDVLLHRVSALEPHLRRVLEAAAVEGEVFHSATVAAVLGVSKEDVLRALRPLVNEHRLVVLFGNDYRFSHAKIRDVVAETLLPEKRAHLHGQTADFLLQGESVASAEIARHMVSNGRGADAVPYLVSAAKTAERQAATGEALSLYAAVTDVMGSVGSKPTKQQLLMLLKLGSLQRVAGEVEKARQTYERVARYAGRSPHTRGEAIHSLGWIHLQTGDIRGAVRRFERARVCFEEDGDRRWIAASADALGMAHRRAGRLETALREGRHALKMRQQLKYRWGEALSQGNLGSIYLMLGRYQRALECYQTSSDILTRRRRSVATRQKQAHALSNLGYVACLLGLLDRSLSATTQALAIRRELDDRGGERISLINLAAVHAAAGLYETARDGFEQGAKLAEAAGDRLSLAEALRSLGALRIREGRIADGQKLIEQSVAEATKAGDVDQERLGCLGLADALLSAGRPEEAALAVESARTGRGRGELNRSAAAFAYARARVNVALGKRRKAVPSFRRALTILKTRPEPELAWRVHRDFGRLLAESARTRAEAKRHFASAKRIIKKVANAITDPRLRATYESERERAALLTGSTASLSEAVTGTSPVTEQATKETPISQKTTRRRVR